MQVSARQHDTGIVGVPGDPSAAHRLRYLPRETGPVGELGQQRGARVGDQILAVDRYFRATDRAITVRLQGAHRCW